MIYRKFMPCMALAEVISHFWYSKVELQGAIIQHHPTPLLQGLAFNFTKAAEHHTYNDKVVTLDKQAYFFGQPVSPREITSHEKGIDIIGVSFRPLGIAKVTGVNMEHLADQIIAAEDIWGRAVETLCDAMQSAGSLEGAIQVLQSFLLSRYECTRLHYRVDNVNSALSLIEQSNGMISIRDLQDQTNTSRKTLERAFLHYLGLKPKFYSQIVRFNAAKAWIDRRVGQQNISGFAYDTGYYDGSHFASEFKRFSGMAPKAYIQHLFSMDAADVRVPAVLKEVVEQFSHVSSM